MPIIDVQFEEVPAGAGSPIKLAGALEVDPEFQSEPDFEPGPMPDVESDPVHAVDLDAQFEPLSQHESRAESRGELLVLAPEPPMALQSGPMLRSVRDVVDYRPLSHEFAYAPEPPPAPPPRRVWNGIGAFVQLTAARCRCA